MLSPVVTIIAACKSNVRASSLPWMRHIWGVGIRKSWTYRAPNFGTSTLRSYSSHADKASYDPASHPDLQLATLREKVFVTEDFLSTQSRDLLAASLKGHMPEVSHKHGHDWMQLGHQQVYFRPHLTPSQLLFDGTDTKFLPGSAGVWKYRLWAGGSVFFNIPEPPVHNASQKVLQIETVQDIRVTGNHAPDKVFLKVRKAIYPHQNFDPEAPKQTSTDLSQSKPMMEELYSLCFLCKPLSALQDRAPIKPPSNPIFTHTMTPDSNLLFQFSALTHNAHKIHFDPHFAREEYGLKNCVVHGPLTQVLLIDFLQRSLSMSNITKDDNILIPISMDYSNFRPLYVNEELILSAKPLVTHAQDSETTQKWLVWIHTGHGKNASLAVKGTIEVASL